MGVKASAAPEVTQGVAETLPDYLLHQAGQRPTAIALREKRLGIWQVRSWAAVLQEVVALAGGLAARGFAPGQTFAILSHPRSEALLLALAVQYLGGTAAPLDPEEPPERLARYLEILTPWGLFVEYPEDAPQGAVRVVIAEGASVTAASAGAAPGDNSDNSLSYGGLLAAGYAAPAVAPAAEPAGIAFQFHGHLTDHSVFHLPLSHRDLLRDGRYLVREEGLHGAEEALASRAFAAAGQARYLLAPWLIAGFRLNFPENLSTRDRDRREIGPTLVAGTRATYERVQALAEGNLPVTDSWAGRLVRWALSEQRGRVGRGLAWVLVRRPLREVLGFARTRHPLILGEPLPPASAAFFAHLGLQVRAWPEPDAWHLAARPGEGGAGTPAGAPPPWDGAGGASVSPA